VAGAQRTEMAMPVAGRVVSLAPAAPAVAAAPSAPRQAIRLQQRSTLRSLVKMAYSNGVAETQRTSTPLPIVFVSAEVRTVAASV
jgi:hypothetical protein